MLILTRRVGESLQIGENIKVTVLSVRGNQVQIGVDAPQEIPVHREEVYERIPRNRDTTQSPAETRQTATKVIVKSKKLFDR